MKITETIQRDCCDREKDCLPYLGIIPVGSERAAWAYCRHCGQVWHKAAEGIYESSASWRRAEVR